MHLTGKKKQSEPNLVCLRRVTFIRNRFIAGLVNDQSYIINVYLSAGYERTQSLTSRR